MTTVSLFNSLGKSSVHIPTSLANQPTPPPVIYTNPAFQIPISRLALLAIGLLGCVTRAARIHPPTNRISVPGLA